MRKLLMAFLALVGLCGQAHAVRAVMEGIVASSTAVYVSTTSNLGVGIGTSTVNRAAETYMLTVSGGDTIDNTPGIELQSSRTSATGRIGSFYVYSGANQIANIDFSKDGAGSAGRFTFTPHGSGGGAAPSMVYTSTGSLGVGTTSPSVVVDVVSTTQGLGIPVMTTAQVQASTPGRAGALIYNSTLSKVCVSTGTTIQGYSLLTGVTTCQ